MSNLSRAEINLFYLTSIIISKCTHNFHVIGLLFHYSSFSKKENVFSSVLNKYFESQRYYRHNGNFNYYNSVHCSSPSIILWECMPKLTFLFVLI